MPDAWWLVAAINGHPKLFILAWAAKHERLSIPVMTVETHKKTTTENHNRSCENTTYEPRSSIEKNAHYNLSNSWFILIRIWWTNRLIRSQHQFDRSIALEKFQFFATAFRFLFSTTSRNVQHIVYPSRRLPTVTTPSLETMSMAMPSHNNALMLYHGAPEGGLLRMNCDNT